MRRKLLSGLLAAAMVLGVAVLMREPLRRMYYQRLRGADLLIMSSERTEQLIRIWDALCEYKAAQGRVPDSYEEWRANESEVDELLQEPRYSRLGEYRVAFELLAVPEVVVVEDPGFAWPGDPEREFDNFRVGLLNDGRIVEYLSNKRIVMREAAPCAEE